MYKHKEHLCDLHMFVDIVIVLIWTIHTRALYLWNTRDILEEEREEEDYDVKPTNCLYYHTER